MCIILPVSHIACTHTIAIWQHCIDATRYGQDGIKPCWNVKQHENAVLTRRPCEDCSGQRYFARRGGVADRGNGSPITPPGEVDSKTNAEDDDADDSGYHSDVIHEEDEASDRDERPLSPKALAPKQPRTKTCRMRKQSHRSLNRKPSWKPNLKRDLSLEYQPRRDSIDSLLSKLDAIDMRTIALMETGQSSTEDLSRASTPARSSRKSRESTLLHPSSPPPMETTGHAQMAKAFPFPQLVDVRKSPRPALRARKNSTLLHPSSPTLHATREAWEEQRPGPLRRRDSSLLHPSRPADTLDFAQHRTILSIPPRQVPVHTQSDQKIPLRKMPALQSTRSDPQSSTTTRHRKASIAPSAPSDSEPETSSTTTTPPSGFACFNFSFAKRPTTHPHASARNRTASPTTSDQDTTTATNAFWNGVWASANDDDVEEEMLRDSARAARQSRRGGERVVRQVVWTTVEGGGGGGGRGEKKFWKC